MTDLDTEPMAAGEGAPPLPSCWRDAARTLTGTPFRDDVRPWNWLELDEHEAEKLWGYLEAFVAYFNARYGERAAHRIPPCWVLHGPIVEELTTLCFARWQAFSSVHASIGGAQYFHAYSLPSFYERLRSWLGTDLLTCQQGHHRARDERPPTRDDNWREQTAALRDEDLWLRLDRPGGNGVTGGTIFVPFVERRGQ